MLNKVILVTFILILVLALNSLLKTNHRQEALYTIKTTPTRNVYVGAWIGGFWEDKTRTLNTKVVKDFENSIDKKMAITNIYIDWTYLTSPEVLTVLSEISANGWTPMISSNPKFFEDCKENNTSLYKTVADGKCDEFLKKVAKNLSKHNGPILFRFAWEMNLPEIYWSVESLKSNPEDFKDAWKHMHKIFEAENNKNVEWVLSFNTSSSKTIPYKQLFPGDEYVDWVAIDGYNWGTSQDWSGWTNFNGVFKKSYDELVALSDKPVMLSEVNSSTDGGDKAAWLTDMLTVQIVKNYPKVKAVVFFSENKFEGESVDWRMEKSEDYLQALKDALRDTIYKSNYP